MAVEGPLLRWVATHRKHHQHSDDVEDPHSPHQGGCGLLGVLVGWWHAHIGWMFKPHGTGLQQYVKDFRKDKAIRGVSRLFGLWVVLGLAIPAISGGLITGSWKGALLGFLWGGLVRVFLVHHVTWSINSVCHLWGTRPFDGGDHSRNNMIFGLLALGEGWHNNHHAFPTSARYGIRWWQLDLGFWVIRALSWLGLAWDVRLPAHKRARQRHQTT
ncbi:MAG: acyl-CoA desaturase [Planctomycetota bacterium]|jgi:stearoyl-CoA desaturase (delta-9 desaturase)